MRPSERMGPRHTRSEPRDHPQLVGRRPDASGGRKSLNEFRGFAATDRGSKSLYITDAYAWRREGLTSNLLHLFVPGGRGGPCRSAEATGRSRVMPDVVADHDRATRLRPGHCGPAHGQRRFGRTLPDLEFQSPSPHLGGPADPLRLNYGICHPIRSGSFPDRRRKRARIVEPCYSEPGS